MFSLTDRLSEHFTARDFAQRGRVLPSDPVICRNLATLAVALEVARGGWARYLLHLELPFPRPAPIFRIACGYRSPKHNAAVKGADNSWHMRGLAADVACAVDWQALRDGEGSDEDALLMQEFAGFLEKFIDRQEPVGELVFGGMGIYTEVHTGHLYWVHIDLRPRPHGRVARWHGHHIGSEQP